MRVNEIKRRQAGTLPAQQEKKPGVDVKHMFIPVILRKPHALGYLMLAAHPAENLEFSWVMVAPIGIIIIQLVMDYEAGTTLSFRRQGQKMCVTMRWQKHTWTFLQQIPTHMSKVLNTSHHMTGYGLNHGYIINEYSTFNQLWAPILFLAHWCSCATRAHEASCEGGDPRGHPQPPHQAEPPNMGLFKYLLVK